MSYCLFCAQNHMTKKELREECSKEKWLPILVMRSATKDCPVVPIFDSADVSIRFAKRNLPPDWVAGIFDIHMRDAEWMDEKGWQAIKFDYPRVLKDILEFDVEILEYEPDHNLVMRI